MVVSLRAAPWEECRLGRNVPDSLAVLYEFIVACVYYSFIGASIAELASAIPSSGGV